MFAAEWTGGYVDKWEYPELIHLVRESEAKFLTFKVTDCLDGSLQESFQTDNGSPPSRHFAHQKRFKDARRSQALLHYFYFLLMIFSFIYHLFLNSEVLT